jgi:hypothetical protein
MYCDERFCFKSARNPACDAVRSPDHGRAASAHVHGFLRKPRDADFVFVIGLPYANRLLIARRYIRAMMVQNVLSAFSCTTPFLLVRILLCGFADVNESGPIVLAVVLELAVSFAAMRLLYDRYLSRPNRHDRLYVHIRFHFKPKDASWFRETIARIFVKLSYTGALFVKLPLQPYVRRHMLYLLRKDWFSSIVLTFFGAACAAVLTAMMSATAPKAVLAANLFIPAGILLANGAAFLESAGRLSECGYYSLSFRDFFKVNVWICGAAFFPFLVGGLACIGISNGSSLFSAVSLLGFVSVVLCMTSLAGCFAFRYCSVTGDSFGTALLVVAFFCSFTGIMSAAAGFPVPAICIPAVPLALLWTRLRFFPTTL